MQRLIFEMRYLPVLLLLATQACSKYVYEHREGRLSRGTFNFLKAYYYQGQFEEEESVEARNRQIINDLADLDAIGHLATSKGLKKDAYYHEYMYREQHARHGKAAVGYWQQKYKDKFNWQMLFSAENLDYDEKRFLRDFRATHLSGGKIADVLVARFEGRPVYYRDLRRVMTVSDYAQFPNYTEQALQSGMRDVLKAWLQKQIHDRLVWQMSADERELLRVDHNRVAVLYLKVKYGKAGKGIYPGGIDNIPLTPTEIYDHFHKMQNTLADVLWVKAAYTVVAEENLAEELIAKLDKGGNFAELAARYAIAPKFIKTAKPTVYQGYDRTKDIEAREKRDYYDRLIIDMAGRDVTKPEPYLGRDGIVVVRIYDVSRALEKIRLQDVSWKVENDLRLKLLGEVYEHDVRDARNSLKIKYNEWLIRRLP
ncbi:MAG: hypothetical protein OHK0011_03650 [Turneriella sp.]